VRRRGFALIAAAAVLWALLGPFSRALLERGLAPLEIAFWRAALGGLMFALHAALTGGVRLRRARDLAHLAAFALLGVTLFYAALVLAIEAGGISLAIVLLYTAPAFVTLLAWPLLGERLTLVKLALLALTLCGVVLVAASGAGARGVQVSPASLGWGLASGVAYASYYLFGKWVLARYAPVTVFALVMPIGALGLLPFVEFAPKDPEAWGLLIALALVSTYLAYLVYYTGLRRVEASRAVLVATIEPVVAAALAAALYGERLGPLGVAGAGLILAAAVATAARRAPRSAPADDRAAGAATASRRAPPRR
jgi:drug/metabolite transporter, DME family